MYDWGLWIEFVSFLIKGQAFFVFKGGCLDDEIGKVKAEEAKKGRYGCCCEFILGRFGG